MKPIGSFLSTAPTLLALLRNVKTQRNFLIKRLIPELDLAMKGNDGSLDENDFKKITQYYGLAVPAILGEAICALRGSKMSEKERLALTYQGASTGLFDDFFDKKYLEDDEVKSMMENPGEIQGRNSSEDLFLNFYRKALFYAHDPALVLKFLRKVYAAQLESKKQAAPGLSREEILRITIDKGGVSVLLYRSAMEHPFRPGEEEALYKMGGLMQFGNDVYDIYKDLQQGIQTLITTTPHISEIRKIFREVMEDSFRSFSSTGYPEKNIRKFLRLVSLSLCSRCFVFFDQLEKIEKISGGIFMPHKYTRQDLVCDMEKTSNKWKTLRYFMRDNK